MRRPRNASTYTPVPGLEHLVPPSKASNKSLCIVCSDPVEFYEQQHPPMCLWCEMHPGEPDPRAIAVNEFVQAANSYTENP